MQIISDKSLKAYNTFGINAAAKYFVEVSTPDDFKELSRDKTYLQHKHLVLGGGSNILFTQNFEGVVIKNSMPGIEVISETETEVLVKANGGVVWHELVLWCIERNYGGIENLSLIPGLTGAAPMQNIGAYGVEIKDVFDELEAMDMHTAETVKFNADDCAFGYRDSVFKGKWKDNFLITSLTLRLTKVNAPRANYSYKVSYGDVKATLEEMRVYELNIKAVSDAIIKIRSAKLPDPAVLGNAGSFFKNPVISKQQFEILAEKYPVMPSYAQNDGTVKIPAGWLIEQCGWKGKVVGNTGSHAKQALVLVNYGKAKGSEIWQLAMDIQQSVNEKFGVAIQPEVNVI